MNSKYNSKNKKSDLPQRQQRIFDFINSQEAGVLACVDPNCEPHATVVYYLIDPKDFSISFLTKVETRKYDNLMRNNHAFMVVFDVASQTVAQIIGEAKKFTNADRINELAARFTKTSLKVSKGKIAPISKLEQSEYVGFKITPKQIRIAFYNTSKGGDYKALFDTIESFELKPGY